MPREFDEENAPLLTGRESSEDATTTTRRSTTGRLKPMFVVGVALAGLGLFGDVVLRHDRVKNGVDGMMMNGGLMTPESGRGGSDEAMRRSESNDSASSTTLGESDASPFMVVSDPFVTHTAADASSKSTSLVRKPGEYMSGDVDKNDMDDVESTPPSPTRTVHLTLYTACAQIKELTFPVGQWEGVVGARVATKSRSSDFLFSASKEMTQSRCGTYEVDVDLADGEEFGFYLYPLDNITDETTVSDIGCLGEGGRRCPGFASPASMTLMDRCTKVFDDGVDKFYNRIFDGQQRTFVFGSCDFACTLPEPVGCPSSAAENMMSL
jgi:hypothetical protein